MADLLVAWVACPILLLGLFTGLGLLVARLAGGALPGPLVPSCGLAAAMALGVLLARPASGAIVPALALLALAGALAGRRVPARPAPGAIVAAGAAFALYATPVVLAGEATFAGYVKLDDTATWLALTDGLFEAGARAGGLEPSSYEAALAINLANGYPLGGFVPLGFAATVLGTDPAWLIQPWMALAAALLALALWQLCGRVLAPPGLRALVAAVAACSALLTGFYLWGGLKEVIVATLVATLAALAAADRPGRGTPAAAAVLAAGLAAAASPGALVWAVPALGLLAWGRLAAGQRGARPLAVAAAALVAATALLALAGASLSPLRDSFTSGGDLGNLARPLEPAQIAGIWPAADFRYRPEPGWLAGGLAALALVAATTGVALALRRGDRGVALYVLGALAVAGAVSLVASPWLEAKALAIASPAVLLAALAGAGMLRARSPLAAGLALAALVAGVGWSLVAQWGGASLAPRDQLAELELLGERLAGRGPVLMTEYQPYGVRHFLRDAAPEGASELRRREVPLRGGGGAPKGSWVDTDDLARRALAPYRALVLRRSPAQSRPPGEFERTWRGRFYEVWERREGVRPALARLALGQGPSPVAVPRCAALAALARRGPAGAALLAARAPRPAVLPAEGGAWTAPGGQVEAWLEGSVRASVALTLDGEVVAEGRHLLNHEGLYAGLGTFFAGPGEHRVALEPGGPDLHPGSAAAAPPGPIVLRPATPARLRAVPAREHRRLCGRAWDWIELRRDGALASRRPLAGSGRRGPAA